MTEPIDMILYCPDCGRQHIDAPDRCPQFAPPDDIWTNPPHRSHLCHGCACVWRPADVATNGVAELKTRGKDDTWPAVHNEEVHAMQASPIPHEVRAGRYGSRGEQSGAAYLERTPGSPLPTAFDGWTQEQIEELCAALDRIGAVGGNKAAPVAASKLRALIAGVPAAPAPVARVVVTDAGWAQLWVHGVHMRSAYGQHGKAELDHQAAKVNAAVGVTVCRFFNGKCIDCGRALTGDVTNATPCADPRQRFEAWAGDQGYPLKMLETSDEYLDLRTQGAWEAYQRGAAHGVKGADHQDQNGQPPAAG